MSKIKKTIAFLSLLASLGLVPLAHGQGCPPGSVLEISNITATSTTFKYIKEVVVTLTNRLIVNNICGPLPIPATASNPTQLLITGETDLLVGQTPIYSIPKITPGESYTVKRTIFKNDYTAYSSWFTAVLNPLGGGSVKKLTLPSPLFAQDDAGGASNMASVLSSMSQVLSQMLRSLSGQ